MIDPLNVNDFNRTDEQLEEYLLFCIVVAGKTAKTQAKALDRFLSIFEEINSPFEKIRRLIKEDTLLAWLKICKLGQYSRLVKCFTELVNSNLDLRTCTTEDLESIPGIGLKTSRFFIVYTRENSKYAILDVHILYFISSLGFANVPKQTPSNFKVYKYWEDLFLDYTNKNQLSVSNFDLEIWTKYSSKKIKKV